MEFALLVFYLVKNSEKIVKRSDGTIVQINKEEAEYIRKHAKDVRISITGRNKKSRNKKRYADENPETFKLLSQFWAGRQIS